MMMRGKLFSGRGLWMLLGCIISLVLAGCVAVSSSGIDAAKAAKDKLIYPEPPDEPRFAYEFTLRGSADVVPATDEEILKAKFAGVYRSSKPFGKPYAVAVHKGRIFVSDTARREIGVFDAPGHRYFTIGTEEGPGHIKKPMGLDVDGSGNVYVLDVTQKFVLVYDFDGKFLRKVADKEDFDRVASVTVEKDGSRLYIVEIGGVKSDNHRVHVFNAQTGEHLFDFGKRGSGPGEFNLPRDLAIGKNGELYVVDGANFRIQVFDHDGKFLRTFGAVGKELGSFARPKEMAVGPDGNVYVIDTVFGNFQIFTPEGQLLMFVGENSTNKDGVGKYGLASGITVDEDGRIYVVDQLWRKVEIFRPYSLPEDQGYVGLRKVFAAGDAAKTAAPKDEPAAAAQAGQMKDDKLEEDGQK
ncbi:MAG: 6-bladed beta-propeller [Gammaproteobacteria bacterium]|nr:6-bladed beta-propeller [Gammaproteobacteria bacterium]